MLTGRTWAGTSQTSSERIGSFIDVATNYIPFSKMGEIGNPGSWYKFKHANKQIPTPNKKGIYEMEMRRYKSKTKNFDAFKNTKDYFIDVLNYANNKKKEEKQ